MLIPAKDTDRVDMGKEGEIRDFVDKPAPVRIQLQKILKPNNGSKQVKADKRETPKAAKPLTLKDFRIAATSASGTKSTKNSNAHQFPQDSLMTSSKTPQVTNINNPSHYRWESLLNSARIREEKVFAMTPSQEYLILDKEQIIDNPNLKVLNSKAWPDFFGIIASEEEEDELNNLKQHKPNYTIADDTVYRKNIEWLAEKKKLQQEKKETLDRQSLEECTFQPNFEAKRTDRLRSSQANKPSTSKLHVSMIQNNQTRIVSPRTERIPSRSASRDGKGSVSYSELHKYRKDVLTETQNKLSLSGTNGKGFLRPKNA